MNPTRIMLLMKTCGEGGISFADPGRGISFADPGRGGFK
jgi:hypothetical protein